MINKDLNTAAGDFSYDLEWGIGYDLANVLEVFRCKTNNDTGRGLAE